MMRESITTLGTRNGGICRLLQLTETRHGAGECGSGEVHLHRRLSRAALASFPEMIRFAAPAGMPIPAAEKNTDAEASKATDPEIEEAAGDDEEPLPPE